MKDLIMENGSYKVVALLITLILWVTVLGSKDLNIYKSVKLDIKVSDNFIISNSVADQVQLQISGSRLSLKKIHKGLSPIQINLTDAKVGRTVVPVPTEGIELPFGSKIISMVPSTLILQVDKVVVKWVPIKVDLVHEDKPMNQIKVLDVKPTGIQLKGASSVLSEIDYVLTDPINLKEIGLDGSKKTFEIRTQIKELNQTGILPIENRHVTILATQR